MAAVRPLGPGGVLLFLLVLISLKHHLLALPSPLLSDSLPPSPSLSSHVTYQCHSGSRLSYLVTLTNGAVGLDPKKVWL